MMQKKYINIFQKYKKKKTLKSIIGCRHMTLLESNVFSREKKKNVSQKKLNLKLRSNLCVRFMSFNSINLAIKIQFQQNYQTF